MPFWPQYPTRTSTLLNGAWSFGYQAGVADVINFPASAAATPNTTNVPDAFDVAQPGTAKNGCCVYVSCVCVSLCACMCVTVKQTFSLSPGYWLM
jgi:hypothetical protein